jgi:C1A family cysteine protease
MAFNRTVSRGLLPLLALIAAGCGVQTMPGAMPARVADSTSAVLSTPSGEHPLNYDWDLYKTAYAPRAHKSHVRRQGMLPSAVDLRDKCAPVYDQGHLGSCTAFSTAKGLREFLQRSEGERQVPLSALFEYYETRSHMPIIGWIMKHKDSGGTVSGAIDILKKEGAAPEETWPYDITKFADKPADASYKAASEFKVHQTTQLASLDDVKATLAGGHPVSFGFRVYESFKKIGADGMMPVPAAGEQLLGGHAVCAVGYDDAKQALIVRNSWSDKWGDKGYFYMPYSVAGDANTADDFWTAQ